MTVHRQPCDDGRPFSGDGHDVHVPAETARPGVHIGHAMAGSFPFFCGIESDPIILDHQDKTVLHFAEIDHHIFGVGL